MDWFRAICWPISNAGNAASGGSQSGSQHAPASGHANRRLTSVVPGERHTGQPLATSGGWRELIWEQEVAGSNPAIPTGTRYFSNLLSIAESRCRSHFGQANLVNQLLNRLRTSHAPPVLIGCRRAIQRAAGGPVATHDSADVSELAWRVLKRGVAYSFSQIRRLPPKTTASLVGATWSHATVGATSGQMDPKPWGVVSIFNTANGSSAMRSLIRHAPVSSDDRQMERRSSPAGRCVRATRSCGMGQRWRPTAQQGLRRRGPVP